MNRRAITDNLLQPLRLSSRFFLILLSVKWFTKKAVGGKGQLAFYAEPAAKTMVK